MCVRPNLITGELFASVARAAPDHDADSKSVPFDYTRPLAPAG